MRLYVIDCGSLAALHYFGAPGEPDAMLMGCSNWLDDFAEKLRPTHAVLCLDSPTSFRKALDPAYKSHRPPMPEDYGPQLRRLPELFARHGITSIGQDGMEADDIIASMVARHGGGEHEIIIVSEDKDISALIFDADKVRQYTPRGGIFLDEQAAKAKYGFDAWRIPFYLALAGDTSDGIAGIKGVGPKTAISALLQTRSMPELFRKARAGELRFGRGDKAMNERIANGHDEYMRSMALVRLRYDCEVPADIEAFALKQGERAA